MVHKEYDPRERDLDVDKVKICRGCGKEFTPGPHYSGFCRQCTIYARESAGWNEAEIRKGLYGKQRDWRLKAKAAPLNDPFPGSEGHHVNEKNIIYIPKTLHHSVYHDHSTGQGMEQINALAFQYLTKD